MDVNESKNGLEPVLIAITCYYNLRELGYYNSQRLFLQFTTGITIHDRKCLLKQQIQPRWDTGMKVDYCCCYVSKN